MTSARDENKGRIVQPGATASPPNSPVKSPIPQPGPQEDDLPEALRAGGAAESALAHAERVKTAGPERELFDQLRNDLRLIRQEYKDPQARFFGADDEGRAVHSGAEPIRTPL
jgi:hypothetical protein